MNDPTARRRRGRPPLADNDASVPVHVKLPGRQYDALYTDARRERVTVPELLRRQLTQAMKEKKEDLKE